MVPAVSRLEEGRSDRSDHRLTSRPRTRQPGSAAYFFGRLTGRRNTDPEDREKREVTGLYESGAGPTRRERRGGGKPALSEVRPGPVVLGLPGPTGTGQVALRRLPAARRVPGRRGRAERALGCLGRRDLRAGRRRSA